MKKQSLVKKTFDMSAVAKDIIKMKITKKDTFDSLWKKFYTIMRKHGIKHGTLSADGIGTIVANFEWTICRDCFFTRVQDYLQMEDLFREVPRDLRHY